MSAVLDDVTDAVAAQLKASNYGVPLDAEVVGAKKKYTLPELEKATDILAAVVGIDCQMTLATRGEIGYAPVVDICLIRKMKEGDRENGQVSLEALRQMTLLAQNIAATFMPPDPDHAGRLDDYEDAAWKSTVITPGYLSEAFCTSKTLVSQIRLTYTV